MRNVFDSGGEMNGECRIDFSKRVPLTDECGCRIGEAKVEILHGEVVILAAIYNDSELGKALTNSNGPLSIGFSE